MADQNLSTVTDSPPVQGKALPWYKRIVSKDLYLDILLGNRTFPVFTTLFILAACFSIMPAITISTQIYPIIKNIENNVNTIIDEVLPEKAEIKISHGILTTNLIEPYYLTINKSTLDTILPSLKNQTSSSKIRLITIDTKAKPEDFERYQSFILLTETQYITYTDGKPDIKPLKNVGDRTFTRTSVKTTVNDFLQKYHVLTILNYLYFVNPLLLILVAGSAIFMNLLISALIIKILVNIYDVKTRYWNIVRFTSAISVVPFLLMALFGRTFSMTGLSINLSISDSFTNVLILWFAYLIIRESGTMTPDVAKPV